MYGWLMSIAVGWWLMLVDIPKPLSRRLTKISAIHKRRRAQVIPVVGGRCLAIKAEDVGDTTWGPSLTPLDRSIFDQIMEQFGV